MRPFITLLAAMSAAAFAADLPILPTPQYLEVLNHSLTFSGSGAVEMVLGRPAEAANPRMRNPPSK